MLILDSWDKIKQIDEGWVLTIGNFDGFHKGHQQIIDTAKQVCQERGAKGVAVMTFDPHPVRILRPEHAPGVLTPINLKKTLIEESGVDCLIVINDNFELLNLSPAAFVDQFLMQTVKPAVVVEGTDFNFGYGRSGNLETLRELGKERGFDVVGVDLEKMHFSEGEYEKVSSSIIRHFLDRGRVADAATALGREYRLVGKSVRGRGVGTKLGFPTANLETDVQVVPDEGVYAGMVQLGDSPEQLSVVGNRLPAVFSLGRVKTFVTDHPLLIEAHVLKPDQQILDGVYDKWMAMDFVCKIRSQQRFESPEKLIEQIHKDCATAHDVLENVI